MKTSIRHKEPQVKAYFPDKARLWEHHNSLQEPVLLPIIASDPVGYLEDCKLNSIDKSVFLHLIGMRNACVILRPSQEYLAKKLGYARETINRSLRRLRELGLVSSVYRHMRPCIYKVAQPYLDPEIRKELRYVGKAFLFMSMLMVGDAAVGNIYQYGNKQYVNPLYEHRSHDKLIRNILLYNPPYISPQESRKKESESVIVGNSDLTRHCGVSGIVLHDPSKYGFEDALTPTKRTKEERPMESGYKHADYSKIKGFKLTRAGEIKLSCFPVEALSYGIQKFRAIKREVREPFRYYWSICKDYCKEHGILYDWNKCEEQLHKEGFHKDSPAIAIEHIANPFIYDERIAPKNGPYATAAIPGLRGGNETVEDMERTLKKARSDGEGAGQFLAGLLDVTILNIEKAIEKKRQQKD